MVYYVQAYVVSDCFGPVRTCTTNPRSHFLALIGRLYVLQASMATLPRSDWVRKGSEGTKRSEHVHRSVTFTSMSLRRRCTTSQYESQASLSRFGHKPTRCTLNRIIEETQQIRHRAHYSGWQT